MFKNLTRPATIEYVELARRVRHLAPVTSRASFGRGASGRSVDWNTERPSGGEGEGGGRGRFASDVSFLRRADGVPCGGGAKLPGSSALTVAGQRLCVSKWLRMTSRGQFPGLSCCARRSSSDHAPQRWSERRWSEKVVRKQPDGRRSCWCLAVVAPVPK